MPYRKIRVYRDPKRMHVGSEVPYREVCGFQVCWRTNSVRVLKPIILDMVTCPPETHAATRRHLMLPYSVYMQVTCILLTSSGASSPRNMFEVPYREACGVKLRTRSTAEGSVAASFHFDPSRVMHGLRK
jgi:hypothetical protein